MCTHYVEKYFPAQCHVDTKNVADCFRACLPTLSHDLMFILNLLKLFIFT